MVSCEGDLDEKLIILYRIRLNPIHFKLVSCEGDLDEKLIILYRIRLNPIHFKMASCEGDLDQKLIICTVSACTPFILNWYHVKGT